MRHAPERKLRRRAGTATTLLLAVVLAACGSQVPRADIETAAGVGGSVREGVAGGPAVDAAPGDAVDGTEPATEAGAVEGATADGGSTAGEDATAAPGPTADGATGSAGAGGAQTAAGTGPPIKLGHIGTYSGILGAIFKGGRETLNAWAQHVNANGGLNGHPVHVITADDQGDPAINLSLTRDMVENQGVVAFVGNIVPLSLTGSRSYVEEKRIPLVGGDLADMAWFSSPMFFPQGGTVAGSMAGSARLAVRKGGPRVGVLYCEISACAIAEQVYKSGVVEQAGGQLVYSARISLAQPDFTGECLSIRSNDADVVAVAADGNTLRRVARSCKQQGVDVKWVSFGLALQNSIADDPNLDGLIGVSSVFPSELTDGAAADYGKAMKTYAPSVTLAGVTSSVWGSATLFTAAARNFPAGAVTSNDVLEGLYALKGERGGGLLAPLTFNRGKPPTQIKCYWELALVGKKFTAPRGLDLTCD